MRDRANQQLRCISRENCIGIECDYVFDSPKRRRVSYYCRERVRRLAAHESVELPELTPLSLPPHPHVLLWIPQSRAVKEIEDILRIGSVLQVQVPNSLFRGFDYFRVVFPGLGWRIGKVAEYCEVKVRIAVREVLHFEMLECFLNSFDAAKESRHDNGRTVFTRNPGFAEFHFRQNPRRHQHRHELIHEADADLTRRQQCENQERYALPPRRLSD